MRRTHIKINEVEHLVGITKKNIRYYEEMGLLSPRRNSENGYRDYGESDVEMLRRVKLLRKLGVPIEEIRRMQLGELTLCDGLRRHGIALERDMENLSQMKALCGRMVEDDCRMEQLDTERWLSEMEKLEQEGTRFMDVKRSDQRRRKLTRAALAALVFIGIMTAFIVLLVWAFAQENRPPVGIMVALLLIPSVLIIGVVLVLLGRVKEIRGGEEDAARKY
ncbi:MAG: MerR family transcriptional regulator [Clostridiaceae bacterium]|nr:MerR family transcriptional regulator [Clostridiaceae bacterium]